jgi:phage terminase large subunit
MWFDEKGCARGLECLRNYRKQWDDKKKTFQDRPFHDWSSHGADALRMLGITYRDELKASGPVKRNIRGLA